MKGDLLSVEWMRPPQDVFPQYTGEGHAFSISPRPFVSLTLCACISLSLPLVSNSGWEQKSQHSGTGEIRKAARTPQRMHFWSLSVTPADVLKHKAQAPSTQQSPRDALSRTCSCAHRKELVAGLGEGPE